MSLNHGVDDYGYQSFVRVAENDASSSFMELPREEDGSLLLSTVTGQFPDAVGLKYRSSSGAWRGIRISGNTLDPPSRGWGDTLYYIINHKSEASKRKADDQPEDVCSAKTGRQESSDLLEDMIVLRLPFNCTNEDLKDYFTNECGELAFHEVKFDRNTGKHRGFGFIRFKNDDGARKALNNQHTMMGRRLEVKLSKKKEVPMKLFVGRIPNGVSQQELKNYFTDFGDISDTYLPTPFRGFGFVTFASSEEGRLAQRMEHKIKGVRLNVTVAEPKDQPKRNGGSGPDGGGPKDDRSFYESRNVESREHFKREHNDNREIYDSRNNRGPQDFRDPREIPVNRGLREEQVLRNDRRPRDEHGLRGDGRQYDDRFGKDGRELRGNRGVRDLDQVDRGLRDIPDSRNTRDQGKRGLKDHRDERWARENSDNRGRRDQQDTSRVPRENRESFRDQIQKNPIERNMSDRKDFFDFSTPAVRNSRETHERSTRERDPREKTTHDFGRDQRIRGSRDQRDPSGKGNWDREQNSRDLDQKETRENSRGSKNFRDHGDFQDPNQHEIRNRNDSRGIDERPDFRRHDARGADEKTDFRRHNDSRGVNEKTDFRRHNDSRGVDEKTGFRTQNDARGVNEKPDFRRHNDARGVNDRTDFRNHNDSRGVNEQRLPNDPYQPLNQFNQQSYPQYGLSNLQPMHVLNPIPPAGVAPDVANELKNMIYQFLGTPAN